MPRSELHEKYDAMTAALDAAMQAIMEFRYADRTWTFDWETREALQSLKLARRYAGKPGEVLYCNWTGCLHAKGEAAMVGSRRDTRGRALLPGEGVQWFKGRIHSDCFEALQRESA